MTNLIISFNAVMPMFLIISLGAYIKWKNLISDHTQSQLNNLSFRVFIPFLLVNNIYQTNLSEVFQLKLIVFTLFSLITMWLLATVFVIKVEKQNFKRGAMIQGLCRSNYTLFGLAVLINLYGAGNIGIPSFLVAVALPLFNVMAVATLEVFRGSKIQLKKIVIGVITNPFIIAIAIGIFLSLTQIQLPTFLNTTISNLSAMAMPIALVAMGAALDINKAFNDKKNLILVTVGRLIVMPLIFVPLAVLVGFRNIELAALMTIFASPTAVVSYTMADQMNSDSDMASAIVIVTTVLSCATIFLWLFITKQIGLI